MIEICHEAGLSSKGTFYHYFESKSDLLLLLSNEMTKETINKLEQINEKSITIREKSEEVIDYCIEISISKKEFTNEILRKLNNYNKLKNNYKLIFEKMARIFFLEVTEKNLYKTRLIMSLIGQYAKEVLDDDISCEDEKFVCKKKILLLCIFNIVDNV